jgi:threonine-phosphate decarboxylase
MIEGHGGNIYEMARTLGCSPWDMVDMSSNVNPLGLPPRLQATLEKHWHEIISLPEVDSQSLQTAFAEATGVTANQVLAGNGTTAFIYTIPLALKIKKALVVGPTYADYGDACRAHGVEPTFSLALEDDRFEPDFEAIWSKLRDVDTVFICNPNNPTGRLLPAEGLKDLIHAHPGVRFVVDESYLPFVPDWKTESLAGSGLGNVIVLQSFSKIFAIPGLRLGFLIAAQEMVRAFQPFGQPWSVNRLAQLAGSFLVSQQDFFEETVLFVENQKKAFLDDIEGVHDLCPFPSAVHFFLFRLEGTLNACDLCRHMARRRILIRDCSNLHGLSDRFIRIALKTSKANRRCVEALKEVLA